MGAVKVEIDSKPLMRALDRLAKGATDMREAMEGIGDALEQSTALRFVDERGPNGVKWDKLSPVTLARRRGGGKGANILQDTGRLKASITHNSTSNSVEVGTNTVYAATHQFGAKMGEYGRYYQLSRLKFDKSDFRRHAGSKLGHPIPWGNIPARPFLGISGEDEEEIIAIIHDHLKQAARP